MSDKLIAGLLAGVVVVPICLLCVLGPVALVSAGAWVAGWFAGLSPMATTGLAIFTGLALYALFRRWGRNTPRLSDGAHE